MNQEQINSLIRNVVMAIAAFLSTYSIGTAQQVTDISALVIAGAMLVWGLLDSSNRPVVTLTRKVVQLVPPVLVSFSVVSANQGAALTTLALTLVTAWSTLEKK